MHIYFFILSNPIFILAFLNWRQTQGLDKGNEDPPAPQASQPPAPQPPAPQPPAPQPQAPQPSSTKLPPVHRKALN